MFLCFTNCSTVIVVLKFAFVKIQTDWHLRSGRFDQLTEVRTRVLSQLR